jgi:hybrid cluster-associated redox disulfide protein
MTKLFNLSSSVESLFERWPKTVQLFVRNQMACPGCYLAEFESLKGALQIYQIKPEPFLNDLHQIITDLDYDENKDRPERPDKGVSQA